MLRVNYQPIYRCNRRKFKEYKDIPNFNGFPDENNFWLSDLEELFDFVKISDEEKVKTMTCKLRLYAGKWWDQLQLARTQQGKSHIRSWPKMRRLLISNFSFYDYKEFDICMDQDYGHGNYCVRDYTKKFHIQKPKENTYLKVMDVEPKYDIKVEIEYICEPDE